MAHTEKHPLLATRAPQELVRALFHPDVWGSLKEPPRLEQGRVIFDLFPGGLPNPLIARVFSEKFQATTEEAVAAMHRLDEYIAGQNAQIALIRSSTQRIGHPVIVMASPASRMRANEMLGWLILKAKLEAAGAEVREVGDYNREHNPWVVWTRDRYVIRADGTVIFPGKAHTEAAGPGSAKGFDDAVQVMRQYFTAQGNQTMRIEGYFEGGNVLQHRQSNTVFVGVPPVGYTHTPDPAALKDAQLLADALGMKLVPVVLTQFNPYYHLDTMMSVLPDGSVMIRPEATDKTSLRRVREAVPAEQFLKLAEPRKKPDSLATNLLTVNGNVFNSDSQPDMVAFLEKRGFRVWVGPHEFGGSGPHCQGNLQGTMQPDGRNDIARIERGDFPKLPAQPATLDEARAALAGGKPRRDIALG
jgi:N-dimethylarginine dimethylaminohydrolase